MPVSSYQLLKDIYAAVNDLEKKIDARMTMLEGRVGNIEKWQNKAIGMASVISSLITLAGTTIWQKLTH